MTLDSYHSNEFVEKVYDPESNQDLLSLKASVTEREMWNFLLENQAVINDMQEGRNFNNLSLSQKIRYRDVLMVARLLIDFPSDRNMIYLNESIDEYKFSEDYSLFKDGEFREGLLPLFDRFHVASPCFITFDERVVRSSFDCEVQIDFSDYPVSQIMSYTDENGEEHRELCVRVIPKGILYGDDIESLDNNYYLPLKSLSTYYDIEDYQQSIEIEDEIKQFNQNLFDEGVGEFNEVLNIFGEIRLRELIPTISANWVALNLLEIKQLYGQSVLHDILHEVVISSDFEHVKFFQYIDSLSLSMTNEELSDFIDFYINKNKDYLYDLVEVFPYIGNFMTYAQIKKMVFDRDTDIDEVTLKLDLILDSLRNYDRKRLIRKLVKSDDVMIFDKCLTTAFEYFPSIIKTYLKNLNKNNHYELILKNFNFVHSILPKLALEIIDKSSFFDQRKYVLEIHSVLPEKAESLLNEVLARGNTNELKAVLPYLIKVQPESVKDLLASLPIRYFLQNIDEFYALAPLQVREVMQQITLSNFASILKSGGLLKISRTLGENWLEGFIEYLISINVSIFKYVRYEEPLVLKIFVDKVMSLEKWNLFFDSFEVLQTSIPTFEYMKIMDLLIETLNHQPSNIRFIWPELKNIQSEFSELLRNKLFSHFLYQIENSSIVKIDLVVNDLELIPELFPQSCLKIMKILLSRYPDVLVQKRDKLQPCLTYLDANNQLDLLYSEFPNLDQNLDLYASVIKYSFYNVLSSDAFLTLYNQLDELREDFPNLIDTFLNDFILKLIEKKDYAYLFKIVEKFSAVSGLISPELARLEVFDNDILENVINFGLSYQQEVFNCPGGFEVFNHWLPGSITKPSGDHFDKVVVKAAFVEYYNHEFEKISSVNNFYSEHMAMESFGISKDFHLIRPHSLIRNIIDTRQAFEDNDTDYLNSKPLRVVFYPRADKNGAFFLKSSKHLYDPNSNLLYFEVSSDTDLFENLTRMGELGLNLETLIIGGHGDSTGLVLGNGESGRVKLSVDDFTQLHDIYKQYPSLFRGTRIILDSCLTGSQSVSLDNIVDIIASSIGQKGITHGPLLSTIGFIFHSTFNDPMSITYLGSHLESGQKVRYSFDSYTVNNLGASDRINFE